MYFFIDIPILFVRKHKNQQIVYFFIDIPVFIRQENIHFVYWLESPHRGDSNKYTKRMIYKKKKKKCSKVSIIDALDGSYQVSL